MAIDKTTQHGAAGLIATTEKKTWADPEFLEISVVDYTAGAPKASDSEGMNYYSAPP